MDKITIVVIDDHPLFRQGVVDSFSLEPDLIVIGQASNGEDAIRLIQDLKPEIAIVDVNLPGMNGQQVTRQIILDKVGTKVILLTAYDDHEQQTHAMRVGASAYCSKDIQPEYLVEVIHQVALGKCVIGDRIFDASGLETWLAEQTENAIRPFSDPGEPFYPLSGREMEVLSYITKGMSNKEIAVLLGISHQTVKNHVTSILRKLGVDDRTQAVIYAVRRGWVRLHQQNISQE
jgi:DNA-binding NarL/FixJ family response regulator